MLGYFAVLQISALKPTEGHELELPWSSAGLGTALSLPSRKAVALLSPPRSWAFSLCLGCYSATAFQFCICLGENFYSRPQSVLAQDFRLGEPSAELRSGEQG